LSRELLAAARGNAERLGARDLFGPVRPTGKAEEPRTPMSDYAGRVRADGLPADPWLRVHVRLGARIGVPNTNPRGTTLSVSRRLSASGQGENEGEILAR
jgi:hypothetical protein